MAGTGAQKPVALFIGGQWVTVRAEPAGSATQEQLQAQMLADWLVVQRTYTPKAMPAGSMSVGLPQTLGRAPSSLPLPGGLVPFAALRAQIVADWYAAQPVQTQPTPAAGSAAGASTPSAQGQWQGPPVSTQVLDPHLEVVQLSLRGSVPVPGPYQPLVATLLASQRITQPTRTQPTSAAAQAGGDASGSAAQGQWQGPGVPMTLDPRLLPLAARHAMLIAPYVTAITGVQSSGVILQTGAGLAQGDASGTTAVGAEQPTTGAFDAIASASATTAVGAELATTGAFKATGDASATTAVGAEQATAGAGSATGSAAATTAVGAEQAAIASAAAAGDASATTATGLAQTAQAGAGSSAGDASATTAAGALIAAGAASAAGDASASVAQGTSSGGQPVVIQVQITGQVPMEAGGARKPVISRRQKQRQRVERDEADIMALAPHIIAHLNSRYGGSHASR